MPQLGPDASRYWLAGGGESVARPFHLRWGLPSICGQDMRKWRAAWLVSWPLLFCGVYLMASPLGWQRATFAAVACLALPGVWGPHVVRPVGVDLPAMALSSLAAGCWVHGWQWAALVLVCIAVHIKETAPLWAALWAWTPVLLIGLLFAAFTAVVIKPKLDRVTAQPHLRLVHDHPVRTALAAHRGRWRDAWLWVGPWGVCLAALYQPSWPVVAVLVVAHLQVLVATDTVRLVQTAAGPAMSIAAASVLPVAWLPVLALVHVFWWRPPEFV